MRLSVYKQAGKGLFAKKAAQVLRELRYEADRKPRTYQPSKLESSARPESQRKA